MQSPFCLGDLEGFEHLGEDDAITKTDTVGDDRRKEACGQDIPCPVDRFYFLKEPHLTNPKG